MYAFIIGCPIGAGSAGAGKTIFAVPRKGDSAPFIKVTIME